MKATSNGGAAFAGICMRLFVTRDAHGDVPLIQGGGWDLYTTGRVAAFVSYGWGDGNPVPRSGEQIPAGGGLDPGDDSISRVGPDGTPLQGTFKSTRVRSGYVPDQLGVGLVRSLNDDTTLKVYLSYWATIEPVSQSQGIPVYLDAREGYLKITSHRWGSLTAGRILELYSRGAEENDFLYHDGYGVGFPGNIDSYGPTLGMIGFGVMAPFYSAGFQYATPTVFGLELSAGVYDPTNIPESFDATQTARTEAELTYDWEAGIVRLHLFGNYAEQTFYAASSNRSATAYGLGYGGRLEVGPAHLGVAGHWGKGLGLEWAFQPGYVATTNDDHLRYFDGVSVLGQVVTGPFDFNAGWGLSQAFPLAPDDTGADISLPSQQAVSGGVVYHASGHLHFDVDAFHGIVHWTLGERQIMDFVNTGVVVTW
jgi:hypothetical protein